VMGGMKWIQPCWAQVGSTISVGCDV